MSADQLRGAVILLVIATFLYGVRLVSQHWSIETIAMPQPERKGDIITAEIKGSKDCNGIYSLSRGSTIYDLFIIARIAHISRFNKRDLSINVHDGDKVNITTEDKGNSAITVEKMEESTRYVLDMPININKATVEDLQLIPGIGKKTAQTIIEYRKMNGMFKSLDDVPCSVGKKKSWYLARYFYIDERSSN
jgi:competence protein ComEA